MAAEHVVQNGVVLIAGDKAIHAAGHLGQRQLMFADGGHHLLPGINVAGDGLFVAQANGVGLGPQGSRLVGGREATCQRQLGLEPIDLIGERGQGTHHQHGFLSDEEAVIGRADGSGQVDAAA